MLVQSEYDEIASYVEQQIALVGEQSNLALMWEGYLLKSAVKHQREGDFLKRSKHPVFHQLNSLLLLKKSGGRKRTSYFGTLEVNQSASHFVLAATC